jgi:hypothetical protein
MSGQRSRSQDLSVLPCRRAWQKGMPRPGAAIDGRGDAGVIDAWDSGHPWVALRGPDFSAYFDLRTWALRAVRSEALHPRPEPVVAKSGVALCDSVEQRIHHR